MGLWGSESSDEILTLRLLMLYVYGAPILDVSRSHTTMQHSRKNSHLRQIDLTQTSSLFYIPQYTGFSIFVLAPHKIIVQNILIFVICAFSTQQPKNCSFSPWRNSPPPLPSGPRPPHCPRFTITLRHITLGRTPLDEWSARCRDLYLTIHNNQSRHPCPRWDSNPQSQQASGRRPTP